MAAMMAWAAETVVALMDVRGAAGRSTWSPGAQHSTEVSSRHSHPPNRQDWAGPWAH